jgi:glutaconate CoA-transferase subunit A
VSRPSKVVSLAEAAATILPGHVVGIGGVLDQMVPVALLGELIRRQVRDLHAVTVAAGLGVDLLLAGGCLQEISCAIVSFENLGTSKLFRRQVEAGKVRFHEHTELTMITRLTAAASGLPFATTRGALGTDILSVNPDSLRLIDCPFTGDPVVACRALQPDVAVIHADQADSEGNVRSRRKHVWHDLVIGRSARRLIVTVEELVDPEVARLDPDSTIIPAFAVDQVVLAPRGAAPTSCGDRYEADPDFFRAWLSATATEEGTRRILGEMFGGSIE